LLLMVFFLLLFFCTQDEPFREACHLPIRAVCCFGSDMILRYNSGVGVDLASSHRRMRNRTEDED